MYDKLQVKCCLLYEKLFGMDVYMYVILILTLMLFSFADHVSTDLAQDSSVEETSWYCFKSNKKDPKRNKLTLKKEKMNFA